MSDATSQNPYAVPASNLQEQATESEHLSIEQALSRGYTFSIGLLINEAWIMVKGSKGIIVAGFLVFYVAMFVTSLIANLVLGLLFNVLTTNALIIFITSQLLSGIISSLVTYPILAGLSIIGVRRAAGQPFSFNDIFNHFNSTLPLLVIGVVYLVLTLLAIALGSVSFGLIFIPFTYLCVAYMLAIPLVVERGLSPWQALEASRKAITQHWFKAFGLFLLLGLIILISAIPLGIGLIWSMPLFVIACGVLYRTIFGVRSIAR